MVHPTTEVRPLELRLGSLSFSGIGSGAASAPLVLLLHGWPQFADSWSGFAPVLAAAGFRAVALDQRGYARDARPAEIPDYGIDRLIGDALGFADALGVARFHLVAHDWGAIVGWGLAAAHPDRLLSFTSLATPHPAALAEARASDPDQQARSAYIGLFRQPGHAAERVLLENGAARLRAVYGGKLPAAAIESNVERLAEPGALTATLNWYRALDWTVPPGPVSVPTLYLWGTEDLALGAKAAHGTGAYVRGPYRFEALEGASHWILDDRPREVAASVLAHVRAHAER
jgi:pimeloyl-ACP methyl ester carboxylesterase